MDQIPNWRSRLSRAPMAVGLALAVGLVACSTTVRSPDLGGLYNRNAREHGPGRNPIIIIPGLTGSKLIDSASGRTVWGAFSGDHARPGKPEDVRLLALLMREGEALRELVEGRRYGPFIGWTDVLFVLSNHLGITKDPIFTDNLLFWLLEKPN